MEITNPGNSTGTGNRISIKSDQLQLNFRLFRLTTSIEDITTAKETVVSRLNSYLEKNGGKILNCRVISKSEIVCYFVTEFNPKQEDWIADVKAVIGDEFTMNTTSLELRPYN